MLCFFWDPLISHLYPPVGDIAPFSLADSTPTEPPRGKLQLNVLSQAPLLRWVLTLSFLVATVAMGLYVM